MQESSGTVFFIPERELADVKLRARSGDDGQLQRLVDYYLLSHSPEEDGTESELQKWLELAADRKLPGAAKSLLIHSSESGGPDCATIKKHALGLPADVVNDLRRSNEYLVQCFAE